MKKIQFKKIFVEQHDFSDCGPACLLMITRYYKGDTSILHLREISGTSNTGTTLLGLCQAARTIGFDANGVEVDDLNELSQDVTPCILSVIKEKVIAHYVVYLGCENGRHIIADPAIGIIKMSSEQLNDIWTHYCLILKPNPSFKNKAEINRNKIEWFINLIRDDYGLLFSSLVLGVVTTLFGASMTLFSRTLIDDLIPNNRNTQIVTGLILLLLIMLFTVLLGALRGKLLLNQKRVFNNRVNGFFMDKLINLPKIKFDNRKKGDFLTRLGDTGRIQSIISMLFSSTIIDILTLIVYVVILFALSCKVGLLILVCSPIVFLIVYYNKTKTIAQQKELMGKEAIYESGFINTISGISDIKSLNCQDSFLKYNSINFQSFQDSIFSLGQTQIRIGIESGLLNVLIQVGLLSFCSYSVLNNSMTIGTLTAVLGISTIVITTITSLASLVIPINEAKVAFQRMFEFLEKDEKAADNKSEFEAIDYSTDSLVLNNVSFRYVGRKPLLKDINIGFNKGSITSIVGESGCGKSTLCQILERFYLQTTGDILLDNTSVNVIPLELWHNMVSFVPQDIFLFNGTIIDNIIFGKQLENIEKLTGFCDKYGFTKFFNELPNGLMTLVGEEGINLSGGQKQLVAFARALFRPSKILILDEITSAMDRKTESFVCDLLKKLKRDHIVIFITHRLETARMISDNIVVIENGSVSIEGNHKELMLSDNYYSQYWKIIRENDK